MRTISKCRNTNDCSNCKQTTLHYTFLKLYQLRKTKYYVYSSQGQQTWKAESDRQTDRNNVKYTLAPATRSASDLDLRRVRNFAGYGSRYPVVTTRLDPGCCRIRVFYSWRAKLLSFVTFCVIPARCFYHDITLIYAFTASTVHWLLPLLTGVDKGDDHDISFSFVLVQQGNVPVTKLWSYQYQTAINEQYKISFRLCCSFLSLFLVIVPLII